MNISDLTLLNDDTLTQTGSTLVFKYPAKREDPVIVIEEKLIEAITLYKPAALRFDCCDFSTNTLEDLLCIFYKLKQFKPDINLLLNSNKELSLDENNEDDLKRIVIINKLIKLSIV